MSPFRSVIGVRAQQCCCGWLPLHPNSHARTVLDFAFLVVMTYDSVMIPYAIAWEVRLQGWVAAAAWLTTGFWTLDLSLGFASGFFAVGEDSDAVMDFVSIGKHYLRSWFLPDAVIVLFDWASILLDTDSDSYQLRIVRMARLGRIFRVLEVLSMGRHDLIFQKFGSLVDASGVSDVIQMTITIVKQGFGIIWLNHCGCCLWHAIGRLGRSESGQSWLDEAEAESQGLEHTHGNLYLLGFIWSTTTMLGESPTPGRNIAERAFQACWLIVGMVFGSLIVSSLAQMACQLTELKKEQTEKRTALRRFLSQQKVDRVLSFAIQREVAARLSRSTRLSDKDVPTLELLSSALRLELRCGRCEQPLLNDPLLRTFRELHRGFLRNLCVHGISYDFYSPGKLVFRVGQAANFTYCVNFGRLHYILTGYATSEAMHDSWSAALLNSEGVGKGAWVAQQALWVEWEHQGTLEVVDTCELVTICKKGFVKAVVHQPDLVPLVRGYAHALVKALQDQDQEFITDTQIGAKHASLVLGMPVEARQRLSEPMLEDLRGGRWWPSLLRGYHTLQELEDEVKAGKCVLVYNAAGEVARVVAMSVVKLRRWDGRILAQVAKRDPSTGLISDIACLLPGRKCRADEDARSTFQRVLSERLGPIRAHIRQGCKGLEQEERESTTYQGLRTLYVRHTWLAELIESEACDLTASTQTFKRCRRSLIDRMRNTNMLAGSDASAASSSRRSLARLRRPTASLEEPQRRLAALGPRPEAFVFEPMVPDEAAQRDPVSVMMWLTDEEFQELSGSREGEAILREWMQELDFSLLPSPLLADGGGETNRASAQPQAAVAASGQENLARVVPV